LKIEKAIKHSDLILIEGGKKQGKLTFSLFTSCIILGESSEILLISPQAKSLMNKRLDIISKFADKKLSNCIENLKLLCLKENYRELKAIYGFEFIMDDIERMVDKNRSNIVILHRLDAMFEVQESSDAEWFIENIVAIQRKKNFKMHLTILKQHLLKRK